MSNLGECGGLRFEAKGVQAGRGAVVERTHLGDWGVGKERFTLRSQRGGRRVDSKTNPIGRGARKCFALRTHDRGYLQKRTQFWELRGLRVAADASKPIGAVDDLRAQRASAT